MRCRYCWTADGIIEVVDVSEVFVADKDCECDHCGTMICAGTPMVLMTDKDELVTMLHESCAAANADPIV